MKKKIVAGILGLTLAVGLSTSAFAAPFDIYKEFNDGNNGSFDGAENYRQTNSVEIQGNASSERDDDYYKFVAPNSLRYEFELTVDRDLTANTDNAIVTLYDSAKNIVKTNRLRSDNTILFRSNLTAGETYYVRVESNYSARNKTFNYNLLVRE
ncbi:hypothetical protein NQ117_10575 [Paenibacillus sp. SC116]|uniref:hypothetical protein n=1 Tax=Paenibacillus sp. SC116 TaxID=2968986 RepID=UPI00215B39F7|nr:hypothetical protein [Paenibacillus sp. SC116]MCR8844130.1 hypothetical protein [Paenibacillus sp. SC116]